LYNSLKDVAKAVTVHDPFVKEFGNVHLTDDLENALRNKDCVIIVTAHSQYFDIRLDWLKRVLTTPVIVDGRNVLDPTECKEAGFTYRGVGVGNVDAQK
jgi:UDP-N-acetyl-D-mannosaminuronic acid dehydrogenase